MSTQSLGSRKSMFRKREVLTAEDMRSELRAFMEDNVQPAFEALAIRVKADIREELRSFDGNGSDHGDAWNFGIEEMNEADHSNYGIPFRNRHIRMNRFRPGLSSVARRHATSHGSSHGSSHTSSMEKNEDCRSEKSMTATDTVDKALGVSAGTNPVTLREKRLSNRSETTKRASEVMRPIILESVEDETSFLLEEEDPDYDDFDFQQMNFRGMVPRKSVAAMASARDVLRSYVQTSNFEHATGLMVLVNAVLLGFETDYYSAGNLNESVTMLLSVSEVIFCVLFTLELVLRMAASGLQFFFSRNWGWNLFDCIVVSFQVTEQIVHFMGHINTSQNTSIIRVLRILRFVRITRLVRLVRLVEELHTIMSSIVASMMALFWTLLLLVMIIYITSVFFTQVALDLKDTKNIVKIHYYYGRLPRALLTMFEVIVGGVSWDEVLEPMIEDVSPLMGVIFTMYIAFCVFAMMNMATGVFVDRAIRKAQEDKDTYTANHISNLFFADNSGNHEITSDIFVTKIDTPDMQEYFKAINVDPSEARGLFQLLDADDSGTVDAEELVNGCLRLRGQAKALELSLIRNDVNQMFKSLCKNMERTNKRLHDIRKTLQRATGHEVDVISCHGDDHSQLELMHSNPKLWTTD